MKKLTHQSLSITEPLNGIIMVVKKSFQTQKMALELMMNIEISVMNLKIKPLALNASTRFPWVLVLVSINMKKLIHQSLSITEQMSFIIMAAKKLSQTQQMAQELTKNTETSASTQSIKQLVLNVSTRFQQVLDLENISMKKLIHQSLSTTERISFTILVERRLSQTHKTAQELKKNIETLASTQSIKLLVLNASTRFPWVLVLVSINMREEIHQSLKITDQMSFTIMVANNLSLIQQTVPVLTKNTGTLVMNQKIKPLVLNASTKFPELQVLVNTNTSRLIHKCLNITEELSFTIMAAKRL